MPDTSAWRGLFATILIAGLCLSGCAAGTSPGSPPERERTVSPQFKEHQRKQRLRAAEGNYKRLYRPDDCRRADRDCDGFPRL